MKLGLVANYQHTNTSTVSIFEPAPTTLSNKEDTQKPEQVKSEDAVNKSTDEPKASSSTADQSADKSDDKISEPKSNRFFI